MAKKKRKQATNSAPRVELHVQRIVQGLLVGESNASIAAACGLTPNAVYKLRGDQRLKDALHAAMEEQDKQFHSQLKAMRGAAIRAHLDAIRGEMPGIAARERLRAAESILDRTGVIREAKVEQHNTGVQMTVTGLPDDFEGKTPEQMLYYAQNGRWPDDAA